MTAAERSQISRRDAGGTQPMLLLGVAPVGADAYIIRPRGKRDRDSRNGEINGEEGILDRVLPIGFG